MLDEDDDDDEMMRQMEAMDTKVQEKKEVIGNKGNAQTSKQQANHSDSEEVPYVPDGFDDVDFDHDS